MSFLSVLLCKKTNEILRWEFMPNLICISKNVVENMKKHSDDFSDRTEINTDYFVKQDAKQPFFTEKSFKFINVISLHFYKKQL